MSIFNSWCQIVRFCLVPNHLVLNCLVPNCPVPNCPIISKSTQKIGEQYPQQLIKMSRALLCALYKCNNNIFHIIPQHSICDCKYDFIFVGTSKNFRTRIIKFFNELFQSKVSSIVMHRGIKESSCFAEKVQKKNYITQKETLDDPIIFRCADISWNHIAE